MRSAPVAVGNTIRGIQPAVKQMSQDVVNVVGRDFVQSALGTGTALNWNICAGFPVTPVAFSSSVLQTYCKIYSKFKFNSLRVIYVTSSATSSNGDILITYSENRSDPITNYNSSTFLNYVLSDPNSMLGIQWENNVQPIRLRAAKLPKILSTGLQIDIDDTTQGEVIIYSRTPGNDSPGYFLIDYDVTFYELGLNPRSGSMPIARTLYTPVQFLFTSGTTNVKLQGTHNTSTRFIGSTVINTLSANGHASGDIYKCVFVVADAGYSAWTIATGTLPTVSTLFVSTIDGGNQAVNLTDGFTVYALCGSSTVTFYASLASAISNTNALNSAGTFTAAYGESSSVPNAGIWLFAYVSFVANARAGALQAS